MRFYPLTLGRTVSLAIHLFRFGWRTFVAISLIAAISVGIGIALVTAASYQQMADWQQGILADLGQLTPTSTTLPTDVLATFPWQAVALSIVASALLGSIAFVGAGALVHAIACAITGEGLSTRRAYSVAFRRLRSLLGLYVVQTVFGLGLAVAGIVGPTLALGGPSVLGGGGPLAFVLIVGLVAVVFLSIFLLIRLVFAVQAMIIEDMSPVAALRRSYGIVAGSMWRVVGYAVVFTMILSLIGIVITLAATMVGLIISPPRGDTLALTSSPAAVFAQVLTTNLLAAVVAPIFTIGMVFLYYDVRWRRGELVPVPGGGESAGRPKADAR